MKRAGHWIGLGTACALAFALVGCGGGDADSASSGHDFASGGSNVVDVSVGPGPDAATEDTFNIPTVSVTVCKPGTSTCVTVDHVLVDTGSSGLRLMASVISSLGLTNMADSANSSNTIAECLPFADGYSWGPVTTADVTIGGESASDIPVHVIDDSSSYSPTIPTDCTSNGTALDSVTAFDANGVLGVGVYNKDCSTYCVTHADNGYYFTCSSSTCTGTALALDSQVANPVASFGTDNNGVILQMPSIAATGATTASGYLVFGIGTESNNKLESATVLTTDAYGEFTTTFDSQTLSSSFIDSGSNGLYFPDSSLATCSGNSDFYCPSTTQSLTATNKGQNSKTSTVSFQIANIDNISGDDYAIDDVGGGAASVQGLGTDYFDWGLPFFYGRTVFTAIEDMSAGSATGPYYAY
ncbi:MAG: DUF3443 domain-containing protein [Steroidobacteraceae bacterium]